MRAARSVLALAAACITGSVVLPQSAPGSAAVAALGGCFADDCSPTEVKIGAGRMLDADTWESAPVDGDWAEFSGANYIFFRAPFGGRTPYTWDIHLSVSANPMRDGNNTTLAAGNVVLVNNVLPDQIAVTNGTCSRYFIRVVLYAAPFPPAPADAGVTDDGGSSDADATAPDASD